MDSHTEILQQYADPSFLSILERMLGRKSSCPILGEFITGAEAWHVHIHSSNLCIRSWAEGLGVVNFLHTSSGNINSVSHVHLEAFLTFYIHRLTLCNCIWDFVPKLFKLWTQSFESTYYVIIYTYIIHTHMIYNYILYCTCIDCIYVKYIELSWNHNTRQTWQTERDTGAKLTAGFPSLCPWQLHGSIYDSTFERKTKPGKTWLSWFSVS